MPILLLRSSASSANSFSTEFDSTENPLSEGGAWRNAGGTYSASWQGMQSASGRAFAADFVSGYDDCVAVISPSHMAFAADQRVRVRLYLQNGYSPSDTHETQLLLRGNLNTDDTISGYEILLAYGASAPVTMKWNGPISDFFGALTHSVENALSFQNGDYLIAEVSGAVISTYRERAGTVQLWTRATDNGSVKGEVIASGQPGICSFVRPNTGQDLDAYCIEYFEATDDPNEFE